MVCFDCLNSTSGVCGKHYKAEEYVTFTTTVSNMTDQEIIEEQDIKIAELRKEIKRLERNFDILQVLLPIILIAMILFVKSGIILFTGFVICWYYADKFYSKLLK